MRLGHVGARLAGEGAIDDAFAGKPGSYEKRFTQKSTVAERR
jgi:hypothetical protein